MIALLCGPITGRDEAETKKLFEDGENWAVANGYEPINPLRQWLHQSGPRYLYMRASFHNMLQATTAIFLPGWGSSRGAMLEANVARELGLRSIFLQYTDDEELVPTGTIKEFKQ